MNSKNTIILTAAVSFVAVVAIGATALIFGANKKEEKVEEEMKSEGSVPSDNTQIDQLLLNASYDLYQDICNSKSSDKEKAIEIRNLLTQLVYTHIRVRDCSKEENLTYIDWVRKLKLPNPVIWETIIFSCVTNGAVRLPHIQQIVASHLDKVTPKVREAIHLTTETLVGLDTVEAVLATELVIPGDEYTIEVESILDIPSRVILTGKEYRVVIEEKA